MLTIARIGHCKLWYSWWWGEGLGITFCKQPLVSIFFTSGAHHLIKTYLPFGAHKGSDSPPFPFHFCIILYLFMTSCYFFRLTSLPSNLDHPLGHNLGLVLAPYKVCQGLGFVLNNLSLSLSRIVMHQGLTTRLIT